MTLPFHTPFQFIIEKTLLSHHRILSTLLATDMAFQALWKRQGNSTKSYSVWYNTWIKIYCTTVCIKIFEFLIKQICHADRKETVTLGQTVIDYGIDGPEIILVRLKSGRH
jgi:hypothetical protein